ncbi:hypothetical protein PBPRB0660 [Photobacterium profundum SS9]|uniref:Uncharacterized protein n=2 Tax=Photobacterium profundum TaxID=74109 RepID=Q6LJJ7_PHOPR|nr:hypothetical protein PBPRB0660 [Photobacterium profundum SS9]
MYYHDHQSVMVLITEQISKFMGIQLKNQEQHRVVVSLCLEKFVKKFGVVVNVNLLLLRRWIRMKYLSIFFLLFSSLSLASSPKCDAPTSWAPNMAYVYLLNNKVLTADKVEHDKTIVSQIASEQIANDIYRQVHHVIFTLKSGESIEVITSNEASSEECSLGSVDVFLISNKFSDRSA